MGFFSSSDSSCSRRSFLKGLFGATVVAIAVPKALAGDGRYVIKLEKRFKPGEFVYVEYGKSIPIHVLSDEEIAHALFAEDIIWDGSEEALSKRVNIMKELMFSVYEKEDEAEFDLALEGLYDFLIAINSALESSFVLLEFMEAGGNSQLGNRTQQFHEVTKQFADHLIRNPGFQKWRLTHKDKLSSAHKIGSVTVSKNGWTSEIDVYEEEDMTLFACYINDPSQFSEFFFSDAERAKIMEMVCSPSHWMSAHLVSNS